MIKHDWLMPELQWLRDNYLLYAYNRDIQDVLTRHTVGSINKKAQELGLTGYKHMHKMPSKYVIRLWWAIQEGPATPEKLMEIVGCKRQVQEAACKAFLEARVVHISHWVKPNPRGHWRPVYVLGDGLNRRRPKANGKTRTNQVVRLESLKGNPFALLTDLSNRSEATHHGDADSQEDKLQRVQILAGDEGSLHEHQQPPVAQVRWARDKGV